MRLRRMLLIGLICCSLDQDVSAQQNDSLDKRYIFLKTVLGDTSDRSFLMRICLWDKSSQQFQFGFISNQELYKYVSKKNSTQTLDQYFDAFYSYPEYGYKWDCFFIDQQFPEVAVIYSYYLPNNKKNRSIKKFLLNYFDSNGFLREQYWTYWPQIANYLYERQIPVCIENGWLPLTLRLADYKKHTRQR